MHYSWSSNHALVAKHNRLVKAAQKDEPEMKHIPVGLGLCLQKGREKIICAGVKPYSPSSPIAMGSKESRLPSWQERAGSPRQTADMGIRGGS